MVSHFLEQEYWHNPLSRWAMAAALLVGITALVHILRSVVIHRFQRRQGATADAVSRTPRMLDDIALDMAHHTSFLFQVAMGVAAARCFLDMPQLWQDRLHGGVFVVVMVQAGLWASGLVRQLIAGAAYRRGPPGETAPRAHAHMLHFVSLLLIWLTVGLLILENLGINVTTLITGLGVTGVAVALATQNIVADLFASISILLDKPFKVGDFIIMDGYLGTVESIGVKTTRIRSLSGEQLIFANYDVTKSRIRNYKSMKERRVVFGFGLRYETPLSHLSQVSEIVRQAVELQTPTRFDRAHLASFGEWALQFEVVYYVLSPNYNVYMDIQQAINLHILERFAAMNMAFAYPVRLVQGPSFKNPPFSSHALPSGTVPS